MRSNVAAPGLSGNTRGTGHSPDVGPGAHTGLSYKGHFFLKKRKHLVSQQMSGINLLASTANPLRCRVGALSGTGSRASPSCFIYFIPNLKISAADVTACALSLARARMWPPFAHNPAARASKPRCSRRGAPCVSGTAGSAPARTLLPGCCSSSCSSFQTPPS